MNNFNDINQVVKQLVMQADMLQKSTKTAATSNRPQDLTVSNANTMLGPTQFGERPSEPSLLPSLGLQMFGGKLGGALGSAMFIPSYTRGALSQMGQLLPSARSLQTTPELPGSF